MITLNKTTYHYQQSVMRFSFDIRAGERVAILGPSGAGKSTLLNLIAGFIYADSGSIILNHQDHTLTTPAQRPVSMLFQENNLFAHLTVRQNIGLGLNPSLRLTEQQQQQLKTITQQVELADYLDRLPAQLSGGQRQRVALARCLVRHQPILLLDEPFSSLDPALRYDMLDLLDSVCQQQNLTLMMVSHNLDDASRIATRSMIINDGKIDFDGKTEDLLQGTVQAAQLLGIKSK